MQLALNGNRESNGQVRNFLYLSIGMAFTGATVAISKPLAAVMPVFLLGFLRCLIAAAALAPFMAGRPATRFAGLGQARAALVGQTVTGVFLFTCFLFFGVRQSTALTAGLVTATLPAAVAVLAWAWLGERLGRRQAFAIAIAIFGVCVLALAEESGSGAGGHSWAGPALLVLAVISEAFYTIYARQTALHLAPLPTAFLVNVLGAMLFAVPGIWQGVMMDWALVDAKVWALIFAFALGSSVFALVFWYMGAKHVEAHIAGLFTAMVPLSAGGVALVFLGETLQTSHILGGGLVLSAILVGARKTAP